MPGCDLHHKLLNLDWFEINHKIKSKRILGLFNNVNGEIFTQNLL